jgi:hypothetical protein
VGVAEDEDLEAADGRQNLQKGQFKYYGKRLQLELVLADQELSELGDREVDPTRSGKEEDRGMEMKGTDIWKDATCLTLLKEGMLLDEIDLEEGKCRNPTLAKCGGEAQHLEKLEIWSPPELPNVQSSTARPKTPHIGVFLVSLET